MKASIRLFALLAGLTLALAPWAQDDRPHDVPEAESVATVETTDTSDEDAGLQAASPADAAATNPESATEAEEHGGADNTLASDPEGAVETAASDDPDAAGQPPGPAAVPAEEAANDEPAKAAADIFIFQGHPIFPPDKAELVYRPLVNYLNDALPYRFDLEISPDYHRYWLSLRRGHSPHLVLEEPHLTAYRMDRQDYTPLVRAEQPITFSLLAPPDRADARARDFIGQRISSMPAPSLGYLILAGWFDNPMQQPIIQSNAASWLDAVEIVFSGEADAAIVPHNLVARYVNLANVLTSQEFPGVTIAASPQVPADIQQEIRSALLRLHDDNEHFDALHELDITRFITADPAPYAGLERWLKLVYSVL